MKAAVVEPMGLENLTIRELPDPTPGPGEVLVRLRAASLNHRDLYTVRGGYGSMQKQSELIPLSDGAGEIAALGAGVREWKVGDRVASCFFPDWQAGAARPENFRSDLGGRHDGVAAELRVFRRDALVGIPDTMSFFEAAALPCAGGTAWNAVIEIGGVGPGHRVLTQGTGGVSLFAVQFAVMAGAEVIATSSSADKLAKLKELGASATINYRGEPEWGKAVKGLTGGRGVDHVVEVGGAETLKQSMHALALGGMISMIGVVTGQRTELNIAVVAVSSMRIEGVNAGSRASLQRMIQAMGHHGVKPVLDRTFALDDLKGALEYLKAGSHVGKVCIEI
jgi:alcohol dehydrogenase